MEVNCAKREGFQGRWVSATRNEGFRFSINVEGNHTHTLNLSNFYAHFVSFFIQLFTFSWNEYHANHPDWHPSVVISPPEGSAYWRGAHLTAVFLR